MATGTEQPGGRRVLNNKSSEVGVPAPGWFSMHAFLEPVRAPGRGLPDVRALRRGSHARGVEQASDFGWDRPVGPT